MPSWSSGWKNISPMISLTMAESILNIIDMLIWSNALWRVSLNFILSSKKDCLSEIEIDWYLFQWEECCESRCFLRSSARNGGFQNLIWSVDWRFRVSRIECLTTKVNAKLTLNRWNYSCRWINFYNFNSIIKYIPLLKSSINRHCEKTDSCEETVLAKKSVVTVDKAKIGCKFTIKPNFGGVKVVRV